MLLPEHLLLPYCSLHTRLISAVVWMRNWGLVERAVQCQRDRQSQNMAQGLWVDSLWTCCNALVLRSSYAPVLCESESMIWMLAIFWGDSLKKLPENTQYVPGTGLWEHRLHNQDAHSLGASVDKYDIFKVNTAISGRTITSIPICTLTSVFCKSQSAEQWSQL